MKIIPKKRRLQRKTNYLKRKNLLENAKSRIVIRKTNRYIIIQYIETEIAQDNVKYSLTSKELLKQGWPEKNKGSLKSLAAGYLTGLLFGKNVLKIAKDKKIILDTGLIRSTKSSRVYATLKGAIDAGIKIHAKAEMLPKEEAIKKTENKEFFDKIKKKITGE